MPIIEFSDSFTLSQSTSLDELDSILGIATFDLNGLPNQYFITEDNPNLIWIQTAFQTLGLRSLLCLDDFDHAIVRGQHYSIVIVQQSRNYVAFLLPAIAKIPNCWVKWAQKFEVGCLQDDPLRVTRRDRFQVG
jgi:hypothetical protein